MNLFECKDIKSYLSLHISRLPKRGRGEINKIANHLGVSSTLISNVLAGQRTLTSEQAYRLAKYLGLIDLEAEYFLALHQLERAGDVEYRKYWKEKIASIKEQSLKISQRIKSEKKITEEERAIYYSSYLYAAIRLYTSVGEKGQTLQNLAARFELSLKKCAEIMKFLVETGFCEEKNGLYFLSSFNTHLEKESPHLLRFQTDWRLKALQAAETLTDEELLFTGPVSLSKADFKLLREELVQVIKRFLDVVQPSPAQEIACLNIDWFWIRK